MYTKQEYVQYAAMLRESGITDEGQIELILNFVYQLSIIAADVYIENLNKANNGTLTETEEEQSGPD
jgi:hypothetical protein